MPINNSTLFNHAYAREISLEDIEENWLYFDDWQDRYQYLIELGKALPSFPESLRIKNNLIHGCQSQAWILSEFDESSKRWSFALDSDAFIVKGLIALVLAAYNNKTKQEIAAIDIDVCFKKLDLFKHISPSRGNGLFAMVQRIQAISKQN